MLLVHFLTSINPPGTIILYINNLLSRFLWGKQDDKAKFQWVAWSDICKPKDEGGLNLRCMFDLSSAYAINLWWKFSNSNSLWSRFMHGKYKKFKAQNFKGSTSVSSQVWRRMQHVSVEF